MEEQRMRSRVGDVGVFVIVSAVGSACACALAGLAYECLLSQRSADTGSPRSIASLCLALGVIANAALVASGRSTGSYGARLGSAILAIAGWIGLGISALATMSRHGHEHVTAYALGSVAAILIACSIVVGTSNCSQEQRQPSDA
jgi:hypothetical protein